jgi:archaellum component FlaG (FlaF/FlaG flagellin family)
VADGGSGVDPSSLQVLVDGSDVTSWGDFDGSRFRYAPGDLGAGVHTISVTVADRAGNVAGPLMWQFAVANPATVHLAVVSGPTQLVFGRSGTIVLDATAGGEPLARTRVLVSSRPAGSSSFGPARVLVSDAGGHVRWTVSPGRSATFRAELVDQPGVTVQRAIGVHRRVTVAADHAIVRRGLPVRLSGSVGPSAPGSRVTVQLLTSRGWTPVAFPRLGGRSGYSATVIPRLPGRYLLRVVAPATAVNLSGTSRTVAIVVR